MKIALNDIFYALGNAWFGFLRSASHRNLKSCLAYEGYFSRLLIPKKYLRKSRLDELGKDGCLKAP